MLLVLSSIFCVLSVALFVTITQPASSTLIFRLSSLTSQTFRSPFVGLLVLTLSYALAQIQRLVRKSVRSINYRLVAIDTNIPTSNVKLTSSTAHSNNSTQQFTRDRSERSYYETLTSQCNPRRRNARCARRWATSLQFRHRVTSPRIA